MPHDDIRALWAAWYGDCPPLGFLLRETFPERWLRIHSLPGGKRYPETGVEVGTVLSRHNTIATDVLGSDGDCMLITHPNFNPLAPRRPRCGRQMDALGLEPLMVVEEPAPEGPDDEWRIPLWAARITWREGSLDDILGDVAADVVGPLLIVSCADGRVFAPYDGGADLILRSREERDQLAWRYAEWLSPHPSGL